jgi:uncharacterized protein (TIGR02147 family)
MNINIYEYIDYKKYLSDWRKAEKERNPGLTHEYLCHVLGQKNRSYFNDLEMGRKFIGPEVLERLTKLLELDGRPAKYFRALIGYGQPTTFQEKEFWFEQIVEMNNTPKKIIEKETFQYFKEWWHAVVRSVLDTCKIDTNYVKLSSLLYGRINPRQAEESILLLSHLGLIEKGIDGFWTPTDKVITTGDNVKDECMKHYQITNHDILRKILEEDVPGTHDSSQLTLSVTKKGLERIINRIRHLRSEIISIAHKDEGQADGVYQIAIHAYPVSKKA